MKKDELLDMITELRVDDAFVDEALGEKEGEAVRVYAGSSKKSPMRIAAPIAACLAVAAAAGFFVVNVARGKLAFGPAASAGITANDISKCKEMLLAELALPKSDDRVWQTNLIDIDGDGNKELFVSSGDKDDFPGVYAFTKTENGIEIAGSFDTEDNLCNAQSIMLYNKDGESFWYYFANGISTFNDGRVTARKADVFKILENDGVISAENIMSMWADYDYDIDETVFYHTINGAEVSWQEYYDDESKFSSQPDIESINNSDLTLSDFYAPLCVEELPEADRDEVYGNDALTLARATLCTRTIGEYEVSVVGQELYSDRELENSVAVDSMKVVLSKNGVLLYSREIGTGPYKAHVKADNLDEVLDFGEFDGTFLIRVKYYGVTGDEPVSFDNPQSEKYYISDDELSMLY